MDTKIIGLIKRKDVDGLVAYFNDMPPNRNPFTFQEEKKFLKWFPKAAVESFINCCSFSEKGEEIFSDVAFEDVFLKYVHLHGLRKTTQKHLIDKKMLSKVRSFLRVRQFDDIDYLLDHGTPEMIRESIKTYPLENDEQLKKILMHKNESLFVLYVSKGRYVSEEVIKQAVRQRRYRAFRAIVTRYHRRFVKFAKNKTIEQMQEEQLPEVMLPETIQQAVFDSDDRRLLELMLRTTPLSVRMQGVMRWKNYDISLYKLHVEKMFCVAGYRFVEEYEKWLFEAIFNKERTDLTNLDECLLKLRLWDDVTFFKSASLPTAQKALKDFWLTKEGKVAITDEGQVAIVRRREIPLILELFKHFTPQYGMCWQAEAEMAKLCQPEVIRLYIDIHTLCQEAIETLRKKWPELYDYYYTRHAY